MSRLDTRALIRMKRRWAAALPEHYFDFEVRYRERGKWFDDVPAPNAAKAEGLR